MIPTKTTDPIYVAMWGQDINKLCALAKCQCCCDEHTFESCPARAWSGCRGQWNNEGAERESWFRHYHDRHGMSEKQFYDW